MLPPTTGGGGHKSCQPMAPCLGILWLVRCTAAVVNGNRGFQGSMSWTAGRGSLGHVVPPAANLGPPPSSLPSLIGSTLTLLGCSGRGRGDGKRGGKWRQRGEGRGGEGRRGASLHRERVEELEDESGERESLPSLWPSRTEARITRLHPGEKAARRTREELPAGCTRLSHSETQGETEPCLMLQSAAKLPRLCEGSRTGSLLGNTERGRERRRGGTPEVSCHDCGQEEGGGSLKSWTR